MALHLDSRDIAEVMVKARERMPDITPPPEIAGGFKPENRSFVENCKASAVALTHWIDAQGMPYKQVIMALSIVLGLISATDEDEVRRKKDEEAMDNIRQLVITTLKVVDLTRRGGDLDGLIVALKGMKGEMEADKADLETLRKI